MPRTAWLARGLALFLVIWPAAALACDGRPLLFLGNSFTRQHDLPGLVTALLAETGAQVAPPRAHLRNGAFLSDSMGNAGLARLVSGGGWCALVLQDHSTAGLSPLRRRASATAIGAFAAMAAPAPVILLAPWPRLAGHPLYARTGLAGPREMAVAAEHHLARLARLHGARLAPAGRLWLKAMAAEGVALHGADGHHAAPAGTWLAALSVVAALGADPAATRGLPPGLDPATAARLRTLVADAPGW